MRPAVCSACEPNKLPVISTGFVLCSTVKEEFQDTQKMTGNYSGDSSPVHYGDVDWIVMDGEEYFGRVAHLFTENPKCCVPNHRPVMEGNASGYPIHEDIILDSHTSKSFPHNVAHLKHITDSLKSYEDIRIAKPNIDEVQRVISATEAHISSLKSKLNKYITKETHQSSGGTPEPLDEETEVQEEPGSESVLSDDEMEAESREREGELSDDKSEHEQGSLAQRKEQTPRKSLQGSSIVTGRSSARKRRRISEVL